MPGFTLSWCRFCGKHNFSVKSDSHSRIHIIHLPEISTPPQLNPREKEIHCSSHSKHPEKPCVHPTPRKHQKYQNEYFSLLYRKIPSKPPIFPNNSPKNLSNLPIIQNPSILTSQTYNQYPRNLQFALKKPPISPQKGAYKFFREIVKFKIGGMASSKKNLLFLLWYCRGR